METQIKAALVTLLDAISRADGQTVAAEMAKLDDFLAQGRATGRLHPQLEHFLGNRSYAKALMFLGGESADRPSNPPGGCASRPAKPPESGGVKQVTSRNT